MDALDETAHSERLTGWGRTAPSRARVWEPRRTTDVAELMARARLPRGTRGIVARGLGRSYGDAAQNGGGAVVRCTAASRTTIPMSTSGSDDAPVLASGFTVATTGAGLTAVAGAAAVAMVVVVAAVTVIMPCMIAYPWIVQ